MSKTLLHIDGEVEQPLELTFADLAAFSEEEQIRDVSHLVPNRRGDAVPLKSIVDRVRPNPAATHLTIQSSGDGFAASVPLSDVLDRGILLYRMENRPLSTSEGGPIRFLIRDSAPCKTAELDACANVKSIDRIELTAGKGHDTR